MEPLGAESVATPLGLRRNLTLDLATAVGIGATTAIIGSLLPTVARREGLGPLELAALASAPFWANFAGAFAGRLGPRTPMQLAISRGVGSGLLVFLVLVPVPLVVIPVAIAFWFTISFGAPLQLRLWGQIYPPRLRGRLLGVLGTGRAAAAGAAALVGGLLADQIGGLTVVALVGVVGAVCALAAAGLRAPQPDAARAYSARSSIRALRERPVLRRVALAQAFYGGGLIAALPLYALVNVDRLSLSLGEVGFIGVIGAIANTAAFGVWGWVADRRGWAPVMSVGSVLGLLSLVAYALAPAVAILWISVILVGIANAAVDIGLPAVMSEESPVDERPAVMAGWNSLTGARGVAAPFIASGLVEAGLVDVTGGLLLCALTSAVGTLLFLRIGGWRLSGSSQKASAIYGHIRSSPRT